MAKLQQQKEIETEKLRQKERESLAGNQLEARKLELEDLRARTDMELKYSHNVPGALT